MANTSEHIVARAVAHYSDDMSVDELCKAIDLDPEVFSLYFNSVDELWAESYVVLLGSTVEAMGDISDLEDAEVQERLATLVFILLDVFEANQAYVDETFGRYASGFRSPFQKALREELQDIVLSPDVPGVSRIIFGSDASLFILSESIVQLINVWRSDDSQQRDRSSALIDRFVSFWAEIISSGVPQRTVDLVRYSVEADYLPIKNIPIVKNWFRSDGTESDVT